MKLPRLRFTVRRMIVAVVVVAGMLALGRELFLGYADERSVIANLQTLGARVWTEPRGLYLLRQFSGERVAERAVGVQCIGRQFDDQTLGALGALEGVEQLIVVSPNVSDAGLARLAHLNRLTRLYLSDTRVTEAGVKSLRQRLPGLKLVDRSVWKNNSKPWVAGVADPLPTHHEAR